MNEYHKIYERVVVFDAGGIEPLYEAVEAECGIEVRDGDASILLTDVDSVVTCERCRGRLGE